MVLRKFRQKKGVVKDSKHHKGIKSAVVRLFGRESSQYASEVILTNYRGSFKLNVDPGKYKVMVYKPGYKQFTDHREISSSGYIFEDIDLHEGENKDEASPFAE